MKDKYHSDLTGMPSSPAGANVLRLLVASLALSLAVGAMAQTPIQAKKLGDYLERSITELNNASHNLLQMTAGLDSPDYGAAIRIYDSARSADNHFRQLYIALSIHDGMVDSRDQATVRKFVVILAKGAVTVAEESVRIANRDLPKIKPQATIAEAQKIRDLIQKMRDDVQRAVPGS